MTESIRNRSNWLNGWRIAGWGSLLSLLLLPALAMQLDADGVNWTGSDFVFAAILLGFLGGATELAIGGARRTPARVAIVIAAVAAFLTIWANGAVGIIGDEGEPLNAGFTLMVLAGVLASALVRLKARPMQAITAVLAVSQLVMGGVATQAMPGHGVEWGVLAVFAILWSAASFLFHTAAKAAG